MSDFLGNPRAYMTGILQVSLLAQHHFLLKGRSKTYKSVPSQRGKVILHLISINPTPGFVFDTVAQFTTTCPLGLFPLPFLFFPHLRSKLSEMKLKTLWCKTPDARLIL